MARTPYEWGDLQAFCFGELGLSPEQFDAYDASELALLAEGYTRRREIETSERLQMAQLIAIATNAPKKLPSLEELLGREKPTASREEYEALAREMGLLPKE